MELGDEAAAELRALLTTDVTQRLILDVSHCPAIVRAFVIYSAPRSIDNYALQSLIEFALVVADRASQDNTDATAVSRRALREGIRGFLYLARSPTESASPRGADLEKLGGLAALHSAPAKWAWAGTRHRRALGKSADKVYSARTGQDLSTDLASELVISVQGLLARPALVVDFEVAYYGGESPEPEQENVTPPRFVDRVELINQLDVAMRRDVFSSGSRIVNVVGEAGVGKTTLVNQFLTSRFDPAQVVTLRGSNLWLFFADLRNGLSRIGVDIAGVQDWDLIPIFSRMTQSKGFASFVVWIDGLESVWEVADLLGVGGHYVAIVTSQDPLEAHALADRGPISTVSVGPLTGGEARAVVKERAPNISNQILDHLLDVLGRSANIVALVASYLGSGAGGPQGLLDEIEIAPGMAVLWDRSTTAIRTVATQLIMGRMLRGLQATSAAIAILQTISLTSERGIQDAAIVYCVVNELQRLSSAQFFRATALLNRVGLLREADGALILDRSVATELRSGFEASGAQILQAFEVAISSAAYGGSDSTALHAARVSYGSFQPKREYVRWLLQVPLSTHPNFLRLDWRLWLVTWAPRTSQSTLLEYRVEGDRITRTAWRYFRAERVPYLPDESEFQVAELLVGLYLRSLGKPGATLRLSSFFTSTSRSAGSVLDTVWEAALDLAPYPHPTAEEEKRARRQKQMRSGIPIPDQLPGLNYSGT